MNLGNFRRSWVLQVSFTSWDLWALLFLMDKLRTKTISIAMCFLLHRRDASVRIWKDFFEGWALEWHFQGSGGISQRLWNQSLSICNGPRNITSQQKELRRGVEVSIGFTTCRINEKPRLLWPPYAWLPSKLFRSSNIWFLSQPSALNIRASLATRKLVVRWTLKWSSHQIPYFCDPWSWRSFSITPNFLGSVAIHRQAG